MIPSRRELLMSALFGAGYVGARSLLARDRRALAGPASCVDPTRAQFIIMNTSAAGDPINTNAPGTYGVPGIVHNPAGSMAATPLTIGGQASVAAKPWSVLPQSVLDRLGVWHLLTNTVVHPKQPDVLRLEASAEMLPSLLARHLAPCLGTIQAQPISLGALTPLEGLTYQGQTLANLSPLAFKEAVTAVAGPLADLQALRGQTVAELDGLYREGASVAQREFLDTLTLARSKVRDLQDNAGLAATIADNGIDAQITTAIALIQMRVTPVVTIHIPFGGDNHSDPALASEAAGTLAGCSAIASLMGALEAAGLADQVTFLSLNVFGRTMGASTANGRQHNPYHQVSLTIGKPFKGGVIGGVGPAGGDFGASSLDSSSGAGQASGDVSAFDTLASFGKTMLAGIGVDATTIDAAIAPGRVIAGALA